MFSSKQWRERKQEERPTGRQPPAGVMKGPGWKMSHETQRMCMLQLLLDFVKLVASIRFSPVCKWLRHSPQTGLRDSHENISKSQLRAQGTVRPLFLFIEGGGGVHLARPPFGQPRSSETLLHPICRVL